MLKDTEDTRGVKEAPNPIFSLKTTGRSVQSTEGFEPAHPLPECAVKVLTVPWYDSVISDLTAATAEGIRITLL